MSVSINKCQIAVISDLLKDDLGTIQAFAHSHPEEFAAFKSQHVGRGIEQSETRKRRTSKKEESARGIDKIIKDCNRN